MPWATLTHVPFLLLRPASFVAVLYAGCSHSRPPRPSSFIMTSGNAFEWCKIRRIYHASSQACTGASFPQHLNDRDYAPHRLPFPSRPCRTPLGIIKSADQQATILPHQKLEVGSSSALPFLFPSPPSLPFFLPSSHRWQAPKSAPASSTPSARAMGDDDALGSATGPFSAASKLPRALRNAHSGRIVDLAPNCCGYRVLQKALDCKEEEIAELSWTPPVPPIFTVNKSLKGKYAALACHETGLLAVQRAKDGIVDELLGQGAAVLTEVAKSQRGSYCIQHILEHRSEKHRQPERLYRLKEGRKETLDCVVQRMCEPANGVRRAMIVHLAHGEPADRLRPPYAQADKDQRASLYNCIRGHIARLQDRLDGYLAFPHIAPRVERWAEDPLAKRRARKLQRAGKGKSAVPVPSTSGGAGVGGGDLDADKRTYELETLVADEVHQWRTQVDVSRGQGSGLRHRKNVGSSAASALDESNILIPYDTLTPTHVLFDPTDGFSAVASSPTSTSTMSSRVPTPGPSLQTHSSTLSHLTFRTPPPPVQAPPTPDSSVREAPSPSPFASPFASPPSPSSFPALPPEAAPPQTQQPEDHEAEDPFLFSGISSPHAVPSLSLSHALPSELEHDDGELLSAPSSSRPESPFSDFSHEQFHSFATYSHSDLPGLGSGAVRSPEFGVEVLSASGSEFGSEAGDERWSNADTGSEISGSSWASAGAGRR
ncbi:hypothetical protein B0H14DRAFT_3511897 [Mycena olivaceomarginata]|nr:hypothetical protein B0H14DRAFT_3511897 [Mycena olivaceomarginata]